MSGLVYAGRSDRGRTRERNEDRWCADIKMGLFVVSDGMGGRPAGDTAAELVVRALPAITATWLGSIQRIDAAVESEFRHALTSLSNDLRARALSNPGLTGMGATVVAAVVHEKCALIGHIGDSRAYLWRRPGHLYRLTTDHSVARALIDSGQISTHEAARHPTFGQLTRYVGQEGDVVPVVRRVSMRRGDRLLLCTDGLTGMLDNNQLLEIFDTHTLPEDTCRALVRAANEMGGRDDITAVVVSIPADDDQS